MTKKILLFLFISVCLLSCKEKLLFNVTEVDSAKIISKLTDEGISVEREQQADGKFAILVEKNDTPRAIKALQEARLLSRSDTDSVKASVGSSREEQKFSFERQSAIEIEKTLVSIDGVLDARVHLNVPAVDPIFGQKLSQSNGSASVLLILSTEANIDTSQVATLVSGASGILPSQVSVMKTVSNEAENLRKNFVALNPVKSEIDIPWDKALPILLLCLVGLIFLFISIKRRNSHGVV